MRRPLVLSVLLASLLPAAALAAPPEADGAAAAEPVPAASEPATPATPAREPVPLDSGPAPESGRDPAVSSGLTPAPEPPPDRPLAPGQDAPLVARHRLVYSNLLVLRVNPLGAEDRFMLGYNYRLFNKTSKLFRDAYIGVAFSPTVSPSIARLGGQLDIAPLSILRLRAGYYFVSWYGSQRFKAHGFHSPLDNYGPNAIGERAERNEAIPFLSGGQAELAALFQIKAGPVAVRNDLIVYNNNIRMPNDANGKQYDVFYDLRHDVLVPAKGWFLTNDTDLLYVTKFGLAAGIRNSLVHVFYPEAVYEAMDDTTANPNTPMDRIGPLISHTFYDRPWKRFNKPTLFFAAQWWVAHRFRGQGSAGDVNQGIPLFLLGFAFSGDLVKSKN